MILEVNIKNSI